MGKVLYDWNTRGRLDDWKLEGLGELLVARDGALQVRTFNCGPLKRATNAWLRDLDLPRDFEVEWTYRNGCESSNQPIVTEGVMLIFNAVPLALKTLWEDPRGFARYPDLFGYGKLVCYTCGYYRTPYGLPNQLRKLGGRVPASWGDSNTVSEDGRDFETLTVVSRGNEPLSAADRGQPQRYLLRRTGARIQFWCNGQLVHDWTDQGQYPYYPESIAGGKLALRNFNGYIDSYYGGLQVREP